MTNSRHRAVRVTVQIETFRLKEPFRITGHTMHQTDVLTVALERDEVVLAAAKPPGSTIDHPRMSRAMQRRSNRSARRSNQTSAAKGCSRYCLPVARAMPSIVRFGTSKPNSQDGLLGKLPDSSGRGRS